MSYKEIRNRHRPYRESEGFILPFEGERQHNDTRGKEPCFVHATEEPRVRGLPLCCSPREVTRKLRRKLCAKAKQSATYCHVLDDEYVGATPLVAPVNIGWRDVHALA